MKTKKISIITMVVALVLIIVGYSLMVVKDYSDDTKDLEIFSSLIKTSFTSYTTSVEDISYDIKELDILNVNYYSDISNNYNTNIDKLNSIETKIKEIDSMSTSLIDECNARNYNDYDIDDKCSVITYDYEVVINAFVSMVNKYNEKIDDYNSWLNNQTIVKSNTLDKYETEYLEYIDIDNDGEYSGIIE